MSRWDTYLERIDEKVSRDEINDALKNDNIIIGCEFEFISGTSLDTASSEASELYDGAYREWQQYYDDVDEYKRDIDSYDDETETIRSKMESKQERVDELEEAISDQEEHNDELDTNIEEADSELEDAEKELKEHEAEKAQWEAEGSKRDWEKEHSERFKRVGNLKVDILRWTRRREENDKTEEKWQKEIKKLNREISDMEDDISYRENDGRYEQVEQPYPSQYSMPDYFEYMINWHGYGKRDFEIMEVGDDIPQPPEWEDYGADNFQEAIENNNILDDAPFGENYEIGDYGSVSQSVGSRKWAVEPDESLGSDGIEVKSPPMPLPKFVPKVISDMFDWIDDIGYTDSNCGFHCHMSLKKSENDIDFLKLVLFTDEGWIYNAFEERAFSTYSRSVKDKIKNQTTISRKELDDLFGRKKLVMKLQMYHEHYDSINLIDSKTGHVEFRYMGGSSYHKKEKDVIATIGMYAHNLSLAMDPEFKRREYMLKLERIFNKMDLYYREKKLELIDFLIKDDNEEATPDDKKTLYLLRKKEATRYKQLASTYKIDNKTRMALDNNRGFYRGVMGEVITTTRKGLSKALVDRIHNRHPEGLR